MNAAHSKRSLAGIGIAAVLAIGNVLAFAEFHAGQASARAAAENLGECKRVADEIETLRQRPATSTLETQSVSELSKRMEEAMKFAQLPAACLIRVDPQAARRVANTEFKQQSTSLELRGVTLKQLIQFLHKLESSQAGLQTSSLHLAAPQRPAADTSAETWTAQVVLTSFIFAPKKTASR